MFLKIARISLISKVECHYYYITQFATMDLQS